MSANPYEIWDKASNDFEVDKSTTIITGDFTSDDFDWKNDECGYPRLSLGELFQQASSKSKGKRFFIRVWYESGMWGVIFETGNYKKNDSQWIVHGITKGYA